MGRPKLDLGYVGEALGYRSRSNTELEVCPKGKSEEFKIGGEKFVKNYYVK